MLNDDFLKMAGTCKDRKRKSKRCYFPCVIGAKHHKNLEKLNSSVLDQQNLANGSMALGTGKGNVTGQLATTPRPEKISAASHTSHRRHLEKRCCRVGYRAAKRGLFCMAGHSFSSKYRNMEHYAKQKFQMIGTPSRGMQRLMLHFDRFCVKPQLKGVFYKCCLDGFITAQYKGRH